MDKVDDRQRLAALLADRDALEREQMADQKQIAEWGGGRQARRRLKASKRRKARQDTRARARAEKGSQRRQGSEIHDVTITLSGSDPDAPNCGHGRLSPAMCPWCNGTNGKPATEDPVVD